MSTPFPDKLEQIIDAEPEPLKNYVAAAVMCGKCAPICKQYGLNGIVGKYEEMSQEYESKATNMLNRISQENGELALLLIRRKLPLLGRRSLLDVANFGGLQYLMACEPIQGTNESAKDKRRFFSRRGEEAVAVLFDIMFY